MPDKKTKKKKVVDTPLSKWKKCVNRAKRKVGVPTKSFVMLKGELLKEARKCYCASGY